MTRPPAPDQPTAEPWAAIACGSLCHELDSLLAQKQGPVITYLDTDLHRTPTRVPAILQVEIDRLTPQYPTIILGYGLCSNSVVGIRAAHSTLIIPRVHDCLDLFLGFVGRGKSRLGLGTTHFYLTPGTILNRKDPLSIMEYEYMPKMGEKMSSWGMKEELKAYTHFALITTDRQDMDEIRRQARRNAEYFNKALFEVKSDLEFFKLTLFGPHDPDHFLHIPPGQAVTQEMFL